jgi:hypothetical protein
MSLRARIPPGFVVPCLPSARGTPPSGDRCPARRPHSAPVHPERILLDRMASRRFGLSLCAFDLLELDGVDLRPLPLEARRTGLTRLVRQVRGGIYLSDHVEADGPEVFRHACMLHVEGIVSKRKGSPYRSGRTVDWIKAKNPASAAARREAEEDWTRRR